MSAAKGLGLPPGVRFEPTAEELLEHYLLPRSLGWPTAVPGIIIDDIAAAASSHHPNDLLTNNNRADDDDAYFFEGIVSSGRSCGNRWTWVGQKRAPDEVLSVRGKQVSWGKYSLNLQGGVRKSGSTGWVMHEYTIASPQFPHPVKLCHVAFTGHGQKRQRVPDNSGKGEGEELEPKAAPPQHKRVATASSVITTATPDHDLGEASAQNQEQGFPIYETSSIGHFWGSEVGFSQESSILDPCYPDARSGRQEPAQNQEWFLNQPQAYHQEQFMNHGDPSIEAYSALLQASDLGSSQGQESPSKNQQLRLQLAQLLGDISTPHCPPIEPASADAAYHEEHIQKMTLAESADIPLPVDQESCTTEQSQGDMGQDDFFAAFGGDLDSFCDTTGVQDFDDMAAGTLAGDDLGDGTCSD